jgi:NAD(P)-dependent dehydrogenase (short-subunit alcohol dehydrogenase family)
MKPLVYGLRNKGAGSQAGLKRRAHRFTDRRFAIDATGDHSMTTNKRLAGRRALVTGAARRGSIGRAIAQALAQEGADVAINDFDRDVEAAEIVAAITTAGYRAVYLPGDVRLVGTCRSLVASAVAALGGLDILINNAGFAFRQPVDAITEADWDHALDLHLKGPFFLAQTAAVSMRAAGRGWIVNISSEQAYIGEPELAHYTAAKGGLRTLSKSLALAFAPEITVNTVCPGPTATDKFKQGREYASGADRSLPRRRWGTPEDVARSVVFLVSADGDAYTGQTLDPNCGAVMD